MPLPPYIHEKLNDKDILRQNYIINKLHCEFWRYNEKLNLLYKKIALLTTILQLP